MHSPELAFYLAALSAALAGTFCVFPGVLDQLVVLKADLVEYVLLLCHLVHKLLNLSLLPPNDGRLLFQLLRMLLDAVVLGSVLPLEVVLAPFAGLQKHWTAFFVFQEVLALHLSFAVAAGYDSFWAVLRDVLPLVLLVALGTSYTLLRT